jgi:hypothetical protein
MKRIPLTQGEYAMVDDENFDRLLGYRWRVNRKCRCAYAVAGDGSIKMHRLILGKDCDGLVVDHINHNGLDNRRENLRACTIAQNIQNRRVDVSSKLSSAFRGVYRPTGRRTWIARIQANGERIRVGTFPTERDAANAYNEAARKHYGPFAETKAEA